MFRSKFYSILSTICLTLLPCVTIAAPPVTVPGSADVSRIKPEERVPDLGRGDDSAVAIPDGISGAPAPESAKKIHFVLREVEITGTTVFSADELRDIYASYIGKDVSLEVAWQIAGGITERYHSRGYFLSRAYVPAQSVKSGKLMIKVVEGYIGDVELKESNYIIRSYISDLKDKRPVRTAEVESFLLKLNDIPGLSFRAVLSAAANKEEANKGAVKLTLVPSDKEGRGLISYDNYGSRFLGPNEVTATYQTSIIPLQNTTISGLTSIPTEELKYGTLSQSILLAPDTILDLTGAYTKAKPGYNLKIFEIDSTSKSLGIGLSYQLVRQRDENLSFKLNFDWRNTDSDILGTELTKDRVRAIRLGATYDAADNWRGFNTGTFTISRGLKIFGSSEEGDLNLSRGDATPDFTKAELSISRLQGIDNDWSIFLNASGQISSDPLFSSEEYGYGGQGFGRAYDSSEITGEDGVSGLAELRFNGVNTGEGMHLAPYIFYDIGHVWQQGTDSTLSSSTSGSSAGAGIRFTTNINLSGNIGVAVPLTLPVGTPIYGYANRRNPRLLLQISQGF